MHSDNFKLRQECLATCDLDITGISETHLYDGQKIELNEYDWYGQNRMKHIKARKGSGGIGILVKNSLLNYYKVEILDSETEGIIWLSFSSKYNNGGFCCCVCYVYRRRIQQEPWI